jgi:mannose-6-phosphate isomerase-like protein (cupin superfamily)
MNNYHFKLVKFQGNFIWHSHFETDETFIVAQGAMRIDFRDGSVILKTGEMFVVPRGKEHKPYAKEECRIILVEPMGTVNTGDSVPEEKTAEDRWI